MRSPFTADHLERLPAIPPGEKKFQKFIQTGGGAPHARLLEDRCFAHQLLHRHFRPFDESPVMENPLRLICKERHLKRGPKCPKIDPVQVRRPANRLVQHDHPARHGVLRNVDQSVFSGPCGEPLHRGEEILPQPQKKCVIPSEQPVVVKRDHPPGDVIPQDGRALPHRRRNRAVGVLHRGDLLPAEAEKLLIAEEIVVVKRLRPGVPHPEKTVALDTVEIVLLHAEVKGLPPRLPDPVEQRVGTVKVAAVRHRIKAGAHGEFGELRSLRRVEEFDPDEAESHPLPTLILLHARAEHDLLNQHPVEQLIPGRFGETLRKALSVADSEPGPLRRRTAEPQKPDRLRPEVEQEERPLIPAGALQLKHAFRTGGDTFRLRIGNHVRKRRGPVIPAVPIVVTDDTGQLRQRHLRRIPHPEERRIDRFRNLSDEKR